MARTLRWNLLQREYNHALVLHGTFVIFIQVAAKTAIVVEPPKSRPNEDYERSAFASHPLQFGNGGLVVFRSAPSFAVPFQKGARPAARQEILAEKIVIYEQIAASAWEKLAQLF